MLTLERNHTYEVTSYVHYEMHLLVTFPTYQNSEVYWHCFQDSRHVWTGSHSSRNLGIAMMTKGHSAHNSQTILSRKWQNLRQAPD